MFRNILMLSAYPMICTDFQNMGGIVANKKHGWVDRSRAPQDPQRAHHNKDPGPDVPASTQPKHGPGRRQRLFPFPLFTVMQFVNSECATNTGDQGRVHFRSGTIKYFIEQKKSTFVLVLYYPLLWTVRLSESIKLIV